MHNYDVIWSDGVFWYLCFNEFVEVFNFFLIVRRELLTESGPCPNRQVFPSHKSETSWRPTFEIFNINFAGDCFGFQLDLYNGCTSATCSVCSPSLPGHFQIQATCFYVL